MVPSSPLERHPSLYFPDGDIALSAKTAAGVTQVFRVDRIFLSRHSEVFRDMLMVSSHKGSADETHDGVPLVSLPTDDSAENVQSLLEVIYDSAKLHQKLASKRRADIPAAVSGLMHIAQKYLVSGVADTIVEGIISMWPRTLAEWDARSLELRTIPPTPDVSYPEPVSTICFFRTCSTISSIPPSVFYQLSITPTNSHWEISHSEISALSTGTPGKLSARWSLLNGAETMLYFSGRDEMIKFAWEGIRRVFRSRFSPGPWSCFSECQSGCSATDIQSIERSYFTAWTMHQDLDILKQLRLLSEAVRSDGLKIAICRSCQESIASNADALRLEIWKKSPSLFSVSPPATT